MRRGVSQCPRRPVGRQGSRLAHLCSSLVLVDWRRVRALMTLLYLQVLICATEQACGVGIGISDPGGTGAAAHAASARVARRPIAMTSVHETRGLHGNLGHQGLVNCVTEFCEFELALG